MIEFLVSKLLRDHYTPGYEKWMPFTWNSMFNLKIIFKRKIQGYFAGSWEPVPHTRLPCPD